jgi:CubicO group peptidase (beta-lactamase class C family)
VAEVHGECAKRFDAVRTALAESLDDEDVGASAAVVVDGELVADVWGGYTDAARTVPWERDTITNVAPRWEPGTMAGCHSVTQGFGVGEVVRRVTGQSLGLFFAEQVAGPLGADFHFTVPAELDERFAPVIAPPSAPCGDLVAARPASGQNTPRAPGRATESEIRISDGNSVAWRRAEIPSGSGYGNARSVAAVQSVLAGGGTAHGVRLLSNEGCERAREEQYRGVDQILGMSVRYGMGYGIFDRSCGWGGWGGSMVMIDLDARLTVAT